MRISLRPQSASDEVGDDEIGELGVSHGVHVKLHAMAGRKAGGGQHVAAGGSPDIPNPAGLKTIRR
jgi:hypothetical protein